MKKRNRDHRRRKQPAPHQGQAADAIFQINPATDHIVGLWIVQGLDDDAIFMIVRTPAGRWSRYRFSYPDGRKSVTDFDLPPDMDDHQAIAFVDELLHDTLLQNGYKLIVRRVDAPASVLFPVGGEEKP